MSIFSKIVLAICLAALFTCAIIYFIKQNNKEDERRIPGQDEIKIIEDDVDHVPAAGDFYIKISDEDINPFEMFYIYRVEEVRKNIYGNLWVKYTAPSYSNNYTPAWKVYEVPVDAFLKGKKRVEKIKKNNIMYE